MDQKRGASHYPSVNYYYFTDNVVRNLKAALLTKQIPASILASGCTAMLVDFRFAELPDSLKKFLEEHFQRYTSTLWLWGQRFTATELDSEAGEFLAVRSGRYFLWPASATNSIKVDGKILEEPILALQQGLHSISIRSSNPLPDPEFFISWLPRNGFQYSPLKE